MTPDEFRTALDTKDDDGLVARCFAPDVIPYVFDNSAEAWAQFRTQTSAALEVQANQIFIIGSGLFGYSLKPANNFRSFRDESDVDVVVVDADLFDRVWYELLVAAYPRPPVQGGGALRERQKALYTGWIFPEDIRFDEFLRRSAKVAAALAFRAQWFDTFRRAGQRIPRLHEEVNARLYRSWKHVELYHVDAFKALRNSLEPRE